MVLAGTTCSKSFKFYDLKETVSRILRPMLINTVEKVSLKSVRFLISRILHYFYTINPFWVGNFGAKVLTNYLNFWESKAPFNSSAHAEHTHMKLMCMLRERISS
jgi:hypothetical protein